MKKNLRIIFILEKYFLQIRHVTYGPTPFNKNLECEQLCTQVLQSQTHSHLYHQIGLRKRELYALQVRRQLRLPSSTSTRISSTIANYCSTKCTPTIHTQTLSTIIRAWLLTAHCILNAQHVYYGIALRKIITPTYMLRCDC